MTVANSIAEISIVNDDGAIARISRMCAESSRRQRLSPEERRDEDVAKTQTERRFRHRFVRKLSQICDGVVIEGATQHALNHAQALERVDELLEVRKTRKPRIFNMAKRGVRVTARRRSYRSPTRRAAKTASGGGDDDGQGDQEPPRHYPHVNSNKPSKSNSFPLPWPRHGCLHVRRRSS